MLNITTNQVLELLQEYWQLSGEVSPLPSYADRNFKVHHPSGDYVFKIANPNWSYADLDIENAALLHLEKTCPDLALPKVILTAEQDHIIPYTTQSKQVCHLRLMRFVEGDVYAKVASDNQINQSALQTSLGVAIAKLNRGLADFSHANMYRYVDWNISNVLALREEIPHIDELHLRDVVSRHIAFFAEHETHWKQQLPMSVIHNDANDFNVIVAHSNNKAHSEVNAIIDFGDMCHHLRVVDLAIAITYALQTITEVEAVQTAMMTILSGYHQTYPLTAEEIHALYHLITTRLSQSILMANRAWRKNPENEYILISQTGVRRLILQLDAIDYAQLQGRLFNACKIAAN